MSVHYKFKSALDFDTITFDGLHISVSDLKTAIIQQKRLGKSSDFDLQITNAQTKEEYPDDGTLIPKNTSLIIARIPLAAQPKKPWDPQSEKSQGGNGSSGSGGGISSTGGASQRGGNSGESNSGTLDLSQMNGTEEDKIQAMMIQSTMDYDPNNYQKIRGQGQTGEVPPNYRCFKCHKPGHWIKNCPLSINSDHIEIKRNTGIPRSFIERDAQEKSADPSPEPPPPAEKKQEIPEDLICSICKDLLTDAVMIPCCGSSFCDECVRTALLESEENECPDCKEKGSSPGLLIPNRFLRNSVNAFKNETGYNKPPHKQEQPKPTGPVEDSILHQPQQKESPQKVASVSQERSSEEKSFREERTSSPVTETEVSQEKDEESNEIPPSTTPPQPPPSRDKKEHEECSATTEVKKQNDVTAHSSHDENESDFEDNITVTVPPAHLQSQRAAFRERHYNGRHSRHLKPPGLENSPKGNSNSQNSPSQEMRTNSPTTDDSEQMTSGLPDQQKPHSIPHHGMPMVRPIRPTGPDMYGGPPMMNSYGHPPQPQPMMVPGRPPYDMGHYGMPPGPGYVPYMRGPFPPMRPGYHPPHLIRPRHMAPMGNFASVYQGVAAKVGSGIIDDPLEAFNRIMREKEKRKGERRRSPERRRSRSIEMNTTRGRHSPQPSSYHGRQSRVRTSEERGRGRSPLPRERRGRSRDKRSVDKDRRRHHSSSFSDRSSRSRSWSIPPRKRSKSPAFRRRTRSRSQSFSVSRSRSRSNSQGRFRGPPPPMRYNRSPMNTMSPRYRQKENRRPERRDDFQREEFRDRSPVPGGGGGGHYMQRRPRSRGRVMSPQNPQYFRQDNRPPFNHGQDEYYHHPPPQQGPPPQMSQPMYNENYQQYNRYPPRDMHIQPHRPDTYGGRDRVNTEYKDRYDDAPPPGTEEPPPPGFENSPPPQTRERRNSWGNDYRKQHDDNQKEYDDTRHTPELRDRQPSVEREDRRRYGRDGRSWSKSHSPVNPSRSAEKVSSRRSRSKTPRIEKNQDNYTTKERGSNKERYTSSREGQGHVSDKEKPEHDKRRDRGGEDRDRKHGEHSRDKDKKDTEKKTSEKESKYATKDDKEKEKEKKRESSDDEKKDRKSREKRKKKKEKDEKKRIKKEKKEREKKEKEKEREKAKENEKEKDSTLPEKDNEKLKSEGRASEEKQDVDKSTVEYNNTSEIKEENELLNDSVTSGVDTKSSVSQDREEEIKFDHEENEAEKKDNQDKFELYGDICQEEEIRYDYVNSQNEDNKTEVTDKSSPTEMKGLDSVLDIHANLDFEPDLEEMTANEENKKDNVMVPLPEPSKWERDDENQSTKDEKLNAAENVKGIQDDDKSSKVTNEVIRRAENAIFARAINAIRPIEIKKISVERQKLYANEPVSDLSPSATSSIKPTQNSPKSELQSFQITVPANRTNSSERSVEIKQEKPTKRPLTPIRSVKDRLGSKITEPSPQKRMRSRSNSPVRNIGRDKGKPARSRSRDFRDTKRGMDNKRSYDNRGRSRDRERIQKDFKPTDYRNRDRLRMNDRNRRDFMNRDRRDKFRERERSRDHDRDKDRRKSIDKSNKGHDRDRSNERNRDRDHGRDTSNRDHHKKWDREKNDNHDNRKDRSHSKSSDRDSRRDRHHKRERDTKKWHSEDEKTKSSERIASENKDKDEKQIVVHKDESQRSEIKDDNEEHNKQIPDKKTTSNENLTKKSDRNSKQTKNQTLTKRSRSKSESSSSSSSSDYDSDSESEDNKKKKRKKHKRDKKRVRRSSSVDSSASTKHKRSKRSKSKKKKSSKKKKKSKK